MEKLSIKKGDKRINEVALKLFATNGYYGTSIEEISNRTGFSKGLILYYYDAKINILDSALQFSISKIITEFDPFNLQKNYNNLNEVFSLTTKILFRNPDFWKLTYQILFQRSSFPKQYDLITYKIDEPFTEVIKEYFSSKTSENVQIYTSMFTNIISGVYYGVLFKNKPYLTEIGELDKIFKL